MNSLKTALAAAGLVLSLGTAGAAFADQDDAYEITITNLTRGQVFTPILAATHRPGVRIFALGHAASAELAILAESGNPGPLSGLLLASPKVIDVTAADDVLPPGHSVTLTLETRGRSNLVSLAGMLVPTNDAFVALNGVRGPKSGKPRVYYAVAYDAGSEANDELCAAIPGPPGVCGGEPVSPADPSDEGYVHVHAGIHGIGDLSAADRDWRNPVAQVIIRKVSDD